MLKSDDTTIQDMLITKPLYAVIGPKQTKLYPLYAMCSEMHDKIPSTKRNYTIAKSADQNLVVIAQKINSSYMQNVIGQGAVWLYTDNASSDDLKRYGATDETIELSLSLLNEVYVNTRLAKELHYSPKTTVEKKDSLIITLTDKLNYKDLLLKYKAENIELHPILFYSGIGLIVALSGTTILLLLRRNKNRVA